MEAKKHLLLSCVHASATAGLIFGIVYQIMYGKDFEAKILAIPLGMAAGVTIPFTVEHAVTYLDKIKGYQKKIRDGKYFWF